MTRPTRREMPPRRRDTDEKKIHNLRRSLKSHRIAIVAAAVVAALVLIISRSYRPAGTERSGATPTDLLSQEDTSNSNLGICSPAIERLVELHIRLVALDFDLTIIDIHTGGHWTGSASELASHVRPEFQCLILHCLKRGISVAVASFSAQEKLIASVLEASMGPPSLNIPVRGGDNYQSELGKQKQLALAMADINERNHKQEVNPSNTLLIDDDPDNVDKARESGFRSLRFDPGDAANVLSSLSTLQR